jgi:hypothetical protein
MARHLVIYSSDTDRYQISNLQMSQLEKSFERNSTSSMPQQQQRMHAHRQTSRRPDEAGAVSNAPSYVSESQQQQQEQQKEHQLPHQDYTPPQTVTSPFPVLTQPIYNPTPLSLSTSPLPPAPIHSIDILSTSRNQHASHHHRHPSILSSSFADTIASPHHQQQFLNASASPVDSASFFHPPLTGLSSSGDVNGDKNEHNNINIYDNNNNTNSNMMPPTINIRSPSGHVQRRLSSSSSSHELDSSGHFRRPSWLDQPRSPLTSSSLLNGDGTNRGSDFGGLFSMEGFGGGGAAALHTMTMSPSFLSGEEDNDDHILPTNTIFNSDTLFSPFKLNESATSTSTSTPHEQEEQHEQSQQPGAKRDDQSSKNKDDINNNIATAPHPFAFGKKTLAFLQPPPAPFKHRFELEDDLSYHDSDHAHAHGHASQEEEVVKGLMRLRRRTMTVSPSFFIAKKMIAFCYRIN